MTKAWACIGLICLLPGATAAGQEMQTNHVVEKVVTRDIPFSRNETLKIVGEKATVRVTGWNKDFVRVKLVFSAKSPDKPLAERELKYMKYALSREGHTLEIRNTFIVPPEITATQSRLGVAYEVAVPRDSKVQVIDQYGNVELASLAGELDVAVGFGDIHLQNVAGRINVESSYGEVRGDGIGGTFSCQSDKSDVYLDRITARCTLNSTYGNIHLTLREKPQGLAVKASRTAVVVSTADFGAYRYGLRTSHASIYVPDPYKKYVKQPGDSGSSTLNFAGTPDNPLISIITTFSPITIHTHP
ncbi:MAG: DUF4097 family beta strand repeat protein [Cytophagales bacterium]|nr:DUF4097 family beta strand repeat protein [Cytophagales bacterium]